MRFSIFIIAIIYLAHVTQLYAAPRNNKSQLIAAMLRVQKETHCLKKKADALDFISFVVPCYNCAHTVQETLDSIYAQDLKPDAFEVICIDDASTDRTWDLLNQYAKRYYNMRVYRNPANQGPAQTRNIAISTLAQGELIYALDADNVLIKNTVRKLLPLIKPHDVDVACFESIGYFESNFSILYFKDFQFPDQKVTIYNAHQAILLMGSGNYLFKKSSFKRAGGYSTFAEETWALSFNMLATGGTFAILPNSHYLHRKSGNSKWIVDEKANRNRNAVLSALRNRSEIFTHETNKFLDRYSTRYGNPIMDFKAGKMHLQPKAVLDCLFAANTHEQQNSVAQAIAAYRQALALGGHHPHIITRIQTLEKAIANGADSRLPKGPLRSIS